MIPEVNEEIIVACGDDMERTIFTERLTKKNAAQKTLEELGQLFGVTRERIRQKERNLLRGLSDGILNDEYSALEYRFRPEFSAFFKKAANALQDETGSLTFEYFITNLAQVWQIDPEDILPHWGFITAILTSKARRPKGTRADDHIPLSLCGNLPDTVSQKPLVQLPLKKHINEFHEAGTSTLGEAVDRTVNGTLRIKRSSSAFSAFNRILEDIEKTTKDADQARPFWLRYAGHAGLTVFPETEIRSSTEFLSCINKNLERILDINSNRKNITDVFRLRTSQPKNKRLTLERTGNALGIHAPSVKMLETLLITLLHSQLIDRTSPLPKSSSKTSF